MEENLRAVEQFVASLSAAVLIGTVSLMLLKTRNVWLETQTARYAEKHKHYFDYIAAHLDDDSPLAVPSGELKRLELQVVEQKLFAWMEQIQGEHRAKLTDLCRRLGLTERNLGKLRSGVRSDQVDAAYKLGVLRCKESVPELLTLLAKEKDDSSLFVIARAIVKCAADISELRSMLRLLVEQRKGVHELIADMLHEAQVDYMPLLLEFMHAEDEELVKIALIALRGQNGPEVKEALAQYAKEGGKDVRKKAVQAWTQQGTGMPPEQIAALLQDDDWEIRAETAKAAGALGSPDCVALLKESVRDEHWQVRYYSALSLAKLNEEGFQALFEVAVSGDDRQSADTAQAVLHEFFWKGEQHA